MRKMKSVLGAFATLLFLDSAFGQTNEAEKMKTRNNDLRGEKAMFAVTSYQKDWESVALLVTGNDQYLFDISPAKAGSGEDARRLKVSNKFAQEADGEFVKKFIELKYETARKTGKRCRNAFTLSLRGEEHKVCEDEKTKVDQIAKIIKNLKDRLRLE